MSSQRSRERLETGYWGGLRAIAGRAHDSMMDALLAEISGQKAEQRRSGKSKATHDLEQFRERVTPLRVMELCDDLSYAKEYMITDDWRYKPNLGWVFVRYVLFGLAMFIAGGYWQQWYTS